MIKLNVEPKVVLSWNIFLNTKPNFSVALDGYVADSTKRDIKKVMANFDHHSNVDRLSTRSTAEQVFVEINFGLFDSFKKNGKPEMNIFVNDCDEDTILSIWLLLNHEQVIFHANPLINKLVSCNDKMDATGGLYPFGDTAQLRKMSWIFAPYREKRKNEKLDHLTSEEMRSVIEACLFRITEYTQGKGDENSIDTDYKIIGGGLNWSLVKESGTSSRMIIFSSGIKTIVSVIEKGRYVIAKKSMWVDFPILELFEKLNELEGKVVWGGSNTIGGSLRTNPSRFSPKGLETEINKFLLTQMKTNL